MRLKVLILVIALLRFRETLSSESSLIPASALRFSSEDGKLWANGKSFNIKGVSWYGFETENFVAGGLDKASADSIVNFIANNSFNAVRIPLSLDLVQSDPSPMGIDYDLNPDLRDLSSLQVLDQIIDKLSSRFILVLLDVHRLLASEAHTGLWYNQAYPESSLITLWGNLTERYCNIWNVFGADLKNEPYQATWGTGNFQTDWNLAVERIGNALVKKCPRWLMFVQGIGKPPGYTSEYAWGENLEGIRYKALTISDPTRVVYSPHVYGPGVTNRTWWTDPLFPENMPGIWQDFTGWIPEKTNNAVVIGEWGGFYDTNPAYPKSKAWMDKYVEWIGTIKNYGSFFWCVNPDSADTGGLLKADWKTPETSKLTLLARLKSSDMTNFLNVSLSDLGVLPDAAYSVSPRHLPLALGTLLAFVLMWRPFALLF